MTTSHPATLAVHAGNAPDESTGAVAPPLHLSTTFRHGPAGERVAGYEYQREGNPTNDRLREALAALEGGKTGIYAELAALELAKAQVEAGKHEDAIRTLRGLKVEGEFKTLIDQRIARLLIETGKPDEALSLLGNVDDGASLEIRGDALVAQDKREQARDLYTQALGKLDVAAPQRRLLEIKLMDAGGSVADPAAEKI